jgi:hypothetical protein
VKNTIGLSLLIIGEISVSNDGSYEDDSSQMLPHVVWQEPSDISEVFTASETSINFYQTTQCSFPKTATFIVYSYILVFWDTNTEAFLVKLNTSKKGSFDESLYRRRLYEWIPLKTLKAAF